MQRVVEGQALTELTETDLKTIKAVYEDTRVSDSTGTRDGIVTFKGPETVELFKGKRPDDDLATWSGFVLLGQLAEQSPVNINGRRHGNPYRIRRLFTRLHVGSPVFPHGIPVGIWRRSTRSSDGDYKVDNDIFDVGHEERVRLGCLARGHIYMTNRERLEDADAKDQRRKMAGSADAAAAKRIFEDMMSAVGMQQVQERAPKPRDLDAVATEK